MAGHPTNKEITQFNYYPLTPNPLKLFNTNKFFNPTDNSNLLQQLTPTIIKLNTLNNSKTLKFQQHVTITPHIKKIQQLFSKNIITRYIIVQKNLFS